MRYATAILTSLPSLIRGREVMISPWEEGMWVRKFASSFRDKMMYVRSPTQVAEGGGFLGGKRNLQSVVEVRADR